MDHFRRAAGALAVCGAVLALGGCGGVSSDRDLSPVTRAFLAGSTVPEPMVLSRDADHCPQVGIVTGTSVIQSQRSVVTLGQIARECIRQADGSTLVKVGIEGRVVLNSNAGGRHDVPLRIAITQDNRTIVARGRRASVGIPAGDNFATFAVVEDGIVVPPSAAQDFEIEVGLGSAPAATPARRGSRG